jgi:ABC-2 type transport system ATP-binding protein
MRCEELSKGMQQKIQFVATAIHRPELMILDEPFSGLDPVNQRLLSSLILEESRRGATILFSTHIMVHAEQLCDRVVMIHHGDKVLDRTLADIHKTYDPRRILFEPLDSSADVEVLRSIPGVRALSRDASSWNISLADDAGPASVIPSIIASIMPSRIEVQKPTLEDIFIDIVAKGSEASNDAVLRAAIRSDERNREVL